MIWAASADSFFGFPAPALGPRQQRASSNEFVGLSVGLRQHFLAGSFSSGQLCFDAFGISQAFGDALATLLRTREHLFVSELVKQQRHNGKLINLLSDATNRRRKYTAMPLTMSACAAAWANK